MKSKIATLTLIGLVSCSLTLVQPSRAQDNPAGSTPATTEEPLITSTETVEPGGQSAAVGTNAIATPVDSTQSETNLTQPQTNGVAATGSETASIQVEVPEEKPEDIIPLIQFQDVQLTTAIENLARQAGINYILDPKVGFGQLDERGQLRAQPNVSIRWENVTASQALRALLQNHGLQLVSDSKTKIARVTVKDPAAPDPLTSRIIQLRYASPSNIVAAVQATFTDKRSKVIGDVRTSQMVVLATEKEQDAVDKLVARLDLQTKQVLIEAKLIESSFNPSTMKGIDWSGTLEAQRLSFGNNLQTAPVDAGESVNPPLSTLWPKLMADTANGFYNPYFLDADGVSAVLSFLNKAADAKIIATPRAVTLDNETAHLSVIRAEPIINVTAGTANTTGGSRIVYTNLGVILDVTPRISANNYVNLKVVPEVSRLFATRSKQIDSRTFQADAYDVRRMETTVMIPSGNTLVLGGLVADDSRSGNTKVPILGDIPVLGYAFRKDTKSRDKIDLTIFITPTIVGDTDFQQNKPSDFLKTPIGEEASPEWSAWDSGKPYDWSH
jgi:type II secretory pathway component GspD/PulD (secretin)